MRTNARANKTQLHLEALLRSGADNVVAVMIVCEATHGTTAALHLFSSRGGATRSTPLFGEIALFRRSQQETSGEDNVGEHNTMEMSVEQDVRITLRPLPFLAEELCPFPARLCDRHAT